MSNYSPWPKYSCHKVVQAQKIVKVDSTFGEFLLMNGEIYAANSDMLAKAQPGWYIVAYEDGFVSVSPPEAFENGYVRISG